MNRPPGPGRYGIGPPLLPDAGMIDSEPVFMAIR